MYNQGESFIKKKGFKMFRDGNNQALQLVMQGYSDSIKANTSNQGTAMANAFNQGLSNAVQTHDNHEQAMQNREATRLQNEYMNKTMDDRVRHQAQQTEANDLANDYTRRTLDDRVAHEEQRTLMNGLEIEGKWLNNNYQAIKNEIADKTKGTEVDKINHANKASVADSKLSKERSEIFLENYTGSTPVRQVGGKYQKLTWRKDKNTGQTYQDWEDVDEATYNRQMEINSNINYNRRVLGKTDITANEMAVAQQANSVVAREMGNRQEKAMQQMNDLLQNENQQVVRQEILAAKQTGQDTIVLNSSGQVVSVNDPYLNAWAGLTPIGYHQSGGIGGGVNVKNDIKTTFKEELRNALDVLKNPNATPEQLSSARSALLQDKDIKAFNYKVNQYAHLAENAQDITEQDRLETFQGFVTQYLGGKAASVYGNLKAKESMLLTGLATNALKGTLTERDMQIVKKQVQDLRKSGGFNEGVLKAMLDKMIDEIQAGINTYETPHILAPENLKRFESIKVLRQALN